MNLVLFLLVFVVPVQIANVLFNEDKILKDFYRPKPQIASNKVNLTVVMFPLLEAPKFSHQIQ